MDIVYRINTAKYEDIYNHLENVKNLFFSKLANRVIIKDYAKKITLYAQKIEAWQNSELIGLLAYYISDDNRDYFVTNISVYEHLQNKGIGASMMLQLKTIAKEKSVDKIKLECARELKILNFYKRNGFIEKNHIKAEISEQVCYLKPLVAIQCFVYNHESFLRDCFEGFVMQQTNFPFVAIVHDDASTDGSAAIIHEYKEKYPHIFQPIYETENQYSKRDGSLDHIMDDAIEATGAKYVAMCEGDDYWIDPLKLQKQVDFMEENEECVLCFTNATVISDNPQERNMYNHLEERDYSAIEIYKTWTIPTNTILWRRLQDYPSRTFKDIYFGDIFLFLNLAVRGRVHCINQKTGVYRRNEGGVSFRMNLSKAKLLIKQYQFMIQYFAEYPDLVEYSKYCVQVYCWYIMYESDASIWEKFRYLRLERDISDTKMLTKSTLSYCLTLIKKTILRRK